MKSQVKNISLKFIIVNNYTYDLFNTLKTWPISYTLNVAKSYYTAECTSINLTKYLYVLFA